MHDRCNEFCEAVRALWPRFRTTNEEIRIRVWNPRLQYADARDLATVIRAHAAAYPDSDKPSWKLIYQELAAASTGGLDDVAIVIMQLRRDKQTEKRFQNASDHEVWKHFVEAQIYPCMFGLGGQFKQDVERATTLANKQVGFWVDWARERMMECDVDPPPWIADVGIPERWLQEAGATA